MWPQVLNEDITMRTVLEQKASLARFGDGELRLCLGINIPNQTADPVLAEKLRHVLVHTCAEKGFCVGIPDLMPGTQKYEDFPYLHRVFMKKDFEPLYRSCPAEGPYYSSFVSRNDLVHRGKQYWDQFPAIHEGRHVVLVSGANRLNGYLSNASAVTVVKCPVRNAFGEYARILAECTEVGRKLREEGRDDLVFILILGPTATVLAYDLHQLGYQAVDVGHAASFRRTVGLNLEREPKQWVLCLRSAYHYFEDYVKGSVLPRLPNAEVKLFQHQAEFRHFHFYEHNRYIFLQKIELKQYFYQRKDFTRCLGEFPSSIYVLNTEHLSRRSVRLNLLRSYPGAKLLDYSPANARLIQHSDQFAGVVPCCVPQPEQQPLKTHEVCMIYPGPSKRRLAVVDRLRNLGVAVTMVRGWGAKRDALVWKHKVLLNVSYREDYRIFESKRCHRCIANGMLVVSDRKEEQGDEYYSRVLFSDYDKLPELVMQVLANYPRYYQQLGLGKPLPPPQSTNFLDP